MARSVEFNAPSATCLFRWQHLVVYCCLVGALRIVASTPELNTTESFEDFVMENGLNETLTANELARYRARFEEQIRRHHDAAASDVPAGGPTRARTPVLKKSKLMKYLWQELPAVTDHLVKTVNRSQPGWTAGFLHEDFTVGDAEALMGYIHDEALTKVSSNFLYYYDVPNHDQQSQVQAARRKLRSVPADFDSRDKWPKCREVIGHIRDQGRCGSCWAQSAAGSMDARLCIATDGKFTGSKAWNSAGYITSCYGMMGIDGCEGGNPGWALRAAQKTFYGGGVPTGSMKDDTCVPYFGHGDALSHFDYGKNLVAPSCPRSCTAKHDYPRSLSNDKFYPTGDPVATDSWQYAKSAVMDGGSIPQAFTVYQDFMSYRTGYYYPTTRQKMGGHATVMIGWKQHEGKDYVLSVNSWGESWGESGLYKLDVTCCSLTFFIEQVQDNQPGLPLPDGHGSGPPPPPPPAPVPAPPATCVDRCGSSYNPSASCQCNSKCDYFGNCCPDYRSQCQEDPSKCRHQCGRKYDAANPCQCTWLCQQYNNCCDDYGHSCSHNAGPDDDAINVQKTLGYGQEEFDNNTFDQEEDIKRLRVVLEVAKLKCVELTYIQLLALKVAVANAAVKAMPLGIEVVSSVNRYPGRVSVLPCGNIDADEFWSQDAVRYVNESCGFQSQLLQSPHSTFVAFFVKFQAPMNFPTLKDVLTGTAFADFVAEVAQDAAALREEWTDADLLIPEVCVNEYFDDLPSVPGTPLLRHQNSPGAHYASRDAGVEENNRGAFAWVLAGLVLVIVAVGCYLVRGASRQAPSKKRGLERKSSNVASYMQPAECEVLVQPASKPVAITTVVAPQILRPMPHAPAIAMAASPHPVVVRYAAPAPLQYHQPEAYRSLNFGSYHQPAPAVHTVQAPVDHQPARVTYR